MKDADILGRALDTLVVAQLRAELPRSSTSPRLYHLRQEQGRRDVDVIVEYGGRRVFGFEVKATSAPSLTMHGTWPGCGTNSAPLLLAELTAAGVCRRRRPPHRTQAVHAR